MAGVIKVLNLGGCDDITDEAVEAIAAECGELEVLNVSYAKISDAALIAVASNCSKLEVLGALECKSLTDEALKAIAARCSDLRVLEVSGCYKITDAGVGAIAARCPKLAKLNISWCGGLTDGALEAIAAGCSKLAQLNADNCNFTRLPVDIGDRLPELAVLDVASNRLSAIPSSIVKLANLRHLDVSRNPIQEREQLLRPRGLHNPLLEPAAANYY
ncbi:hypothetical protein CTAYLR_000556 [Chrysophaeum taylorii]|uniref:F-box/LRR-repeat protein 15-like leucin rich repeat domain-containing protein n=1 Tax=Chrysophaeum taylorii TaxID=2483200 RepID=A0AAD7XQX8_9STRA|nr:hypothetical protein CTAYLR_000556 [Chrysophaeum taylorii]